MYAVTRDAVERARTGEGPTLIEAVTYRIGSHSTADDAARYRDEEEVTAWRERDPIDRYRTHLLDAGTIDDAFARLCDEEAEAWVANVRAELTALGAATQRDVRPRVRRPAADAAPPA